MSDPTATRAPVPTYVRTTIFAFAASRALIDTLKAEVVARRLRMVTALSSLILDDVDGVVAILCGATRAIDVAEQVDATARREFGDRYCGVISRPVQVP